MAQHLLEMPDIKLLSVIRVMCEVRDNKTNDMNFNTQIGMQQTARIPGWNLQTKLDADTVIGDKTNIPNYPNSSTNKTHMSDYFHCSNNKKS